jgi:hypothetical protein
MPRFLLLGAFSYPKVYEVTLNFNYDPISFLKKYFRVKLPSLSYAWANVIKHFVYVIYEFS